MQGAFASIIYIDYVYRCASLPSFSIPPLYSLSLVFAFVLPVPVCGFLINVNRYVLNQCNIIALLSVDCKHTTD